MARPGATIRTDPRTTRPDDDGADPGLAAFDPRVVDVVLAATEAVDALGHGHDEIANCGILPIRPHLRAISGLS